MFRIGTRKREDAEIIWWFEIPAHDIHRARRFYEEILKIKMTMDETEIYKTAFFPIFNDHIGGAIVQGDGYTPSGEGSKIYLNGHPNLQEILDRIPSAGGEVLVPKSKSSQGYIAWFKDSEGNKIALYSQK